ncbi:hypothetical protein QQM79_14865 [Marinobacteraceae bacterium S3BR75-40.1]
MQKVFSGQHGHELRAALTSLLQSQRVNPGDVVEVDILSTRKGLLYSGSLLLPETIPGSFRMPPRPSGSHPLNADGSSHRSGTRRHEHP